jgi:hypothetical protein
MGKGEFCAEIERFTRHVARDRDVNTRPSLSAILAKCFTCPFDTVFERSDANQSRQHSFDPEV